MKALKILSVAVLLIFSASWNTSDTETVALNKSEKKLSILLKGYKKMTKAKVLSKKQVQAFSKKKIKAKGLKVTKVAVVEYATKGKLTRKVYVLEVNGDLSFMAFGSQYSNAVNQEEEEGGTSDGDEGDCEILTESCGGDDCACYCVIYNTCDPDENESNPDCCSDCDCGDDGDGFDNGFDNFMETLMP